MSISIVIADDHDIIRSGIKSILSEYSEYDVVDEASNGDEALEKVKKLKPEILLMDISMPERGGLDVIKQINYVSPKTKVIIVTVHKSNIYISKAFKLGVKGYIHKANVVEELLSALSYVVRGELYVSPKVSQYVVEELSQKRKEKQPAEIGEMTERESDVLRLVVEGKTAKEIADLLFISRRTVENYKNILLRKFQLHRTSDLIKYAIQHKIVEIDDGE